jgi:hypothetical protein
MLGQDSWDRKAGQDRIARTGQPENVRMVQAGQERGQDGQNMTEGELGQDN